MPGSPIFRGERKTSTITATPPATPKNQGRGVSKSPTNFHAMTVSVSNTNSTGAGVVTCMSCTTPTCYTTTRSAAMMALAFGQRAKRIPANTRNNGVISVATTTTTIKNDTSGEAVKSCLERSFKQNVAHMLNGGSHGGSQSGGSASSGSDDGFNTSSSSSATALRRLYFKSGRNNKPKTNPDNIPLGVVSTTNGTYQHNAMVGGVGGRTTTTTTNNASAVPKVIVMGSSASTTDTNINTSTDSACTLITNVTHTDTSETCDSLDLGDNSCQSEEPLFSSLEEPLLTAVNVDSEYAGTEFELTSCTMYSSNLQDSTESQESSLSIIAGSEVSFTTPLLVSNKRNGTSTAPSTAPSLTKKHFSFDKPLSPKSARSTEKSGNHFFNKDMEEPTAQAQLKRWNEQTQTVNKPMEEKTSVTSQNYEVYREQNDKDQTISDGIRRKKSRNRENNVNRYSTGGVAAAMQKTSPKRERKRSPTPSKISSAPPTMKDGNFFGGLSTTTTSTVMNVNKQHQLSPSAMQRKYSSSSSSGGSERDRARDHANIEHNSKDVTMFPFDREAIDYERIQRECFARNDDSSSAANTTASSESDEAEQCSVYERKLSSHSVSPKSSVINTDVFQQYTLLSQREQQSQQSANVRRNSSKRIRSDFVMQSTIRENQQYMRQHYDAFYPRSKNSTSPGELNKFEDIATKFDQIPPKTINNNNNQMEKQANNNNNQELELLMQSHKKTSKNKAATALSSVLTHDLLDECQFTVLPNNGITAGPINVTSNPMEAAVCTQPRATIVVQQPSLSLDNTVETLLIKNEGDFISVEQAKKEKHSLGVEVALGTGTRKRNSQQLQYPLTQLPSQHSHQNPAQQQQQQQLSQQQQQQQQLKRDENMRQLLDVTNTLTIEELRDFEMRYGSPHHSRSQSVKTPGSRASGRPNQLCLPQQRSRVASMPNTGVEEEYYRLRHFSITGKGVINRGDSLKSRRSRSNNSVASSNSSNEHLTTTQVVVSTSARNSANCSLASSRESSTSNPGSGPYRVLMLGGPAVGKSSLVSQFMTSEYLHAYDTSIDDDSGEKSVSVLLNGEESELVFIDHPYPDMTPDDCLANYDPQGYCVIYSTSDRSSFNMAEHVLQVLWTNQNIAQKAVILVANKADLARSRLVTSEEGKAMATAYDCKFIETSVGINHNVDELLVGLLSQIRLKLENPEKSRDLFRKRSIRKSKRRACSPLSGACLTGNANASTPLSSINNVITDVASTPPGSAHSSPRKYRGSRTSTSLKVKGLLGRVWARDSKSKSCENLHVL